MTLKRILALTDLSKNSLPGLRAAEVMGCRLGARVLVGHAHTRGRALLGLGAGLGGGGGRESEERLIAWAKADDEERLGEMAREHIEALRLEGLESVDAPSARDGVADLLARHRPDLVCMATHGRTGLKHILLGSVAEQTIRTAALPVLVAKHAPLPAATEPMRVLVALDLIEDPAALLARVAPFLKAGDRLGLVHVVESYYYSPAAYGSEFALPQPDVPKLIEAARERMARIENLPDLAAPELFVIAGHAVDSILHFEEEWKPHLIVTSTHGRRGFDRMMLGSVSERLARKCRAAILVVPARREATR